MDEEGNLLFQKLRYVPKMFQIRRPALGGWAWDRRGVPLVPYRLPELIASDYVFLSEGEKDVDCLQKMGLPATCSPDGAGSGKFRSDLVKWFSDKSIYILPDNDLVGKNFSIEEANILFPVAKSVKILDLRAIYPDLPAGGDISDVAAALGADATKAALLQLVEAAPEWAPDRGRDSLPQVEAPEWAELIPFERLEDLPFFPLHVLPRWTRDYISAVAETVQAPADLVGCCVLGALEVACRGRYPVRLPSGHIERACLYLAPIAPPSERKSGVVDLVFRPLVEFERDYNKLHGGEVLQNLSELKLLRARIVDAEQRAVRGKKIDERLLAEDELRALNNELASFEPVEELRLFGADVTPEKLAAMLKAQGSVFALVSAEGGGLFENIGRYSDRGGLELYLNGYSGDRVCVDRKSCESIVIDFPVLTIMAPCQPHVVADLFADLQKVGRGLLSRILFVRCSSRVGSRRAMSTPLDENVRIAFYTLCRDMLAGASKGELAYSDEGFAVYAAFHDEIEPRLHPEVGDLSHMADWAGKLPGQMTRLAGLVHCISACERGGDPLEGPISAEEAAAAVELANFFLAHSMAVYAEQAESPRVADARYLWGKVQAMRTDRKNELTRMVQGKRDFSLDEALIELARRGYIRVDQTPTGNAGRPSPRIVVNPEVRKSIDKIDEIDENPSGIPPNTHFVNFVNKITAPANLQNVPAADFSRLVEVPAGEVGPLPFGEMAR
ncbi:MAG: DUF3987 domain-containing protein [Gracilibacteraceae bacterium]|nr:DUF3987 domain-containing protein [Gracilibacteraceae bacterium]